MTDERVVIHVDMDAFFAAIEQRDHPEYRGKPVIVGADPKEGRGRGVVSTASYEAREYGIHSAMPISQAWRRCPHGVFVRCRGEVYQRVSRQLRDVFLEFTPVIEPVSIDEAFLDVSGSLHLFGGKRALAECLQARIREETDLTGSLGVAPNKMVAKIASDMDKPEGLVVVEPSGVKAFLAPLPASRLWGVGPRTRKVLTELSVQTIGDLAGLDPELLARPLGKHGPHLWLLAQGIDERSVHADSEIKSVGHEHTFGEDVTDRRQVTVVLMQLCENVAWRLRRAGLRGRTVTTKLRLADFSTRTRARTVSKPVDNAPDLFRVATANLERVGIRGAVRLIGVSVSGFGGPVLHQASFLERGPAEGGDDRRRSLGRAIDRVRERFGEGVLRHGRGMSGPASLE